jgi:hypothetical protein
MVLLKVWNRQIICHIKSQQNYACETFLQNCKLRYIQILINLRQVPWDGRISIIIQSLCYCVSTRYKMFLDYSLNGSWRDIFYSFGSVMEDRLDILKWTKYGSKWMNLYTKNGLDTDQSEWIYTLKGLTLVNGGSMFFAFQLFWKECKLSSSSRFGWSVWEDVFRMWENMGKVGGLINMPFSEITKQYSIT